MLVDGKKYLTIIIVLLLFVISGVKAQEVTIDFKEMPLSEVLISLHKKYGVQISYNHQLVSKCVVTQSAKYGSIEEAIFDLISVCKLEVEKNGGVYIVYEKRDEKPDTVRKVINHYYSGHLVDAISKEALPFASIETSASSMIADVNGNFSLRLSDNVLKLKVSYLGYYKLDTVINPGIKQKFELMPSLVGLQEVVVNPSMEMSYGYIGNKAGLVKLNHKVATFLPGNNNNTLFNMLRLQPGIQASAEQTGDYSIWGSYRGQNLLKFDGITLFNTASLSNEIGIINPLIVKDVEIYKGGFGVEQEDRVGGIINTTGKQGSNEEFYVEANVNSQTVSGLMNFPIADKYSFQAAFRQSYYSVIDWRGVFFDNEVNDDSYEPEYSFQDLNLKFSGRTESGDNFFISVLGNKESSEIEMNDAVSTRINNFENETERDHTGISAFYNKNWNRFGSTNTILAYSGLNISSFDRFRHDPKPGAPKITKYKTHYKENSINEISLKVKHQFPVIGAHNINSGFSVIQNGSSFTEDTVKIDDPDRQIYLLRYNYYIKDKISLGRFISVEPGIKIDYLPKLDRSYIQPRISADIKPFAGFKINMAWGKYNQYLTELGINDEFGNTYYFWQLSDTKKFPVMKGEHSVLGFSYKQNGLELSSEGYYKTIDGLSTFILERGRGIPTVTHGKVKSYGADFYVKKRVRKHEFWMSYSISRVEDNIKGVTKGDYRVAPQDQTHEFKGAGIINLKPWYISFNYIYGSGLKFTDKLKDGNRRPYHRMDMAFLYRFKTKKFNLETGLSVVNVFDHKNIGFNGFTNLPNNKSIYASGLPFTPSIFVNVRF